MNTIVKQLTDEEI